jgi:hypothetical protein
VERPANLPVKVVVHCPGTRWHERDGELFEVDDVQGEYPCNVRFEDGVFWNFRWDELILMSND